MFKFSIQNDGPKELEADAIINIANPLITVAETIFYDSEGNTLPINANAKFYGERSGQGYTNVTIQPGEIGYCWIGIKTDKKEGFPYLRVNNGFNDVGSKRYTWLNTDPEYNYDEQDIDSIEEPTSMQ